MIKSEKNPFDKFIDNYNKKCGWLMTVKKLYFQLVPKGVAIKDGPKAAWDTVLAYPYASNRYDDYFDFSTKMQKFYFQLK